MVESVDGLLLEQVESVEALPLGVAERRQTVQSADLREAFVGGGLLVARPAAVPGDQDGQGRGAGTGSPGMSNGAESLHSRMITDPYTYRE